MNISFIQKITGMNDRDAENLMFLIASPSTTLEDWFEKTDSYDHTYAQELLYIFKEALTAYEIDNKLKKTEIFSEAEDVINKFKLK